MWNCFTSVILDYQRRFSDWVFVRHEDLARDPITGFKSLFASVELDYTSTVLEHIAGYSSQQNPTRSTQCNEVKRDSQATIKSWRRELPASVIAQIRQDTEPIARHFYSKEDWS